MLASRIDSFFNATLVGYKQQKYLLAVSGGMDSMILLHLMNALHLNIAVAHCNFHLRGAESDADEQFVLTACDALGVPCYVEHFDVGNAKASTNEGTQLTARNLRYAWFEELRKKLGYHYICTAHHQQDNAETLIHRFMQGAYPESLQGIKPLNGMLLRPFLFVPYPELAAYAGEHAIQFRTDSSNLHQHYTRNKIRHTILPALKEVYGEGFQKNIESIAHRYTFYYDLIRQQAAKVVQPKRFWKEIDIEKLREVNGNTALLYEVLKNYGFNWIQCEEICNDLFRHHGSYFENNDRKYKLFFTTRHLQLVPAILTNPEIKIHPDTIGESTFNLPDISVQVKHLKIEEVLSFEPDTLYLDAELLKDADIRMRFREPGDHFTPLGMQGNKSVADFLKDKGLSPAEKEYCRIITYQNRIIGLLGYRVDEHFKVTERTINVLVIRSWNTDDNL